jgi:two-component system response regulator AgrA
MNIVIFEDDTAFADRLKTLIDGISPLHSTFTIKLISNQFDTICRYIEFSEEPTVFILDIMLDNSPKGLKMADVISKRQQNAIIVFITDYPNQILSNTPYKIKAFNFILKSSSQLEYELKLTLREAVKFTEAHNIFIHSDKFTTVQIEIDGIFYIETIINKNKIRLHSKNGIYDLRTSLDKLIKRLPLYFIRCHNSYIVNTKKITSMNFSTRSLKMTNGDTCYYSYKNRKQLNDFISVKVNE